MIAFGGRISIILSKLSCVFLYPAVEGDSAYLVLFVLSLCSLCLCVSKSIVDFCICLPIFLFGG